MDNYRCFIEIGEDIISNKDNFNIYERCLNDYFSYPVMVELTLKNEKGEIYPEINLEFNIKYFKDEELLKPHFKFNTIYNKKITELAFEKIRDDFSIYLSLQLNIIPEIKFQLKSYQQYSMFLNEKRMSNTIEVIEFQVKLKLKEKKRKIDNNKN
jgi:hypothetical protein